MADYIEYLKSVDSPTVSNAIEVLNIRPRSKGFLPLSIKSMFPEFGRMVGYAVTAEVETITQREAMDPNQFIELYAAVAASPKPAVIAFQEIGGHPDYAAHCGEVMATAFSRLGAIGLLSDAGVRDLPEVHALGFQYFARGAVASHGYFRIHRVGGPIQIEGEIIRPGDLIHADQNGVLFVPSGLEESLPKAVEAVRVREKKLMDYMKSDQFTVEGLRGIMVE
ncbi:MAG: RraA family protein [Bryobacterales bacterium]|nr:RraA family protein [Bryobacterales bacterium]